MMTYVLDTNIVSYAIKGDKHIYSKMSDTIDFGGRLVLPHVVFFEVVRWLIEANATARKREFEMLCQTDVKLQELKFEDWLKAADLYVQLRKKGAQPGDADLLIAAFCLTNGYTLVTNNTKDFELIDGLKLANWTE